MLIIRELSWSLRGNLGSTHSPVRWTEPGTNYGLVFLQPAAVTIHRGTRTNTGSG